MTEQQHVAGVQAPRGASAYQSVAGETRPSLTLVGLTTLLFILVMPIVNVAGPSVWFTLPALTAGGLFALLWWNRLLVFDRLFLALLTLALWCFLPWFFSAEYISPKTLLHAVAVISTITIYYAAVRCGLQSLIAQGRTMSIITVAYLALFGVSVFILFELIVTNVLGIDLNHIIPYIEVPEFTASALGFYKRPRGLASEPGVMALFYDFMLFFVLPRLRTRRYLLGYVFVIVPAYLVLVSTASIVSVLFIATLIAAFRFLSRVWTGARILIFAAIAGCGAAAVWGEQLAETLDLAIVTRVAAFAGAGEDSSADARRGQYAEVAQVVSRYPWGIGFGITPGLSDVGGSYRGIELSPGQISLFGMFLVAGGLVGGLGFTAIVGFALWRAMRAGEMSIPIAGGGIALTLHHLVVTEYWLPFFWFFFATASAFCLSPFRGSAAFAEERTSV